MNSFKRGQSSRGALDLGIFNGFTTEQIKNIKILMKKQKEFKFPLTDSSSNLKSNESI